MKLKIKNGLVLDMVGEPEVKDILIENDKIIQIDKNITKEADETIDASYQAVMPGLINCHNHVGMSIFRGYSDDLELQDWLQKAIWPIEDNLKADDVYYSSKLGCIEMLKSGTTTFSDMYFFMEDVAKAMEETGIRGMIGRTILSEGKEADKRIQEAEKLYKEYHNKAEGRIKVNVVLHAPYTCPPDVIKKGIALSEKYNVDIQIHLSETEKENEDIQKEYEESPTQYLNNLGLFSRHCVLAHGVHLSEKDLEILKDKNVGISHNPISNLKLASGIADIVKYRKLGLTVGLGTDGSGSTNTLDMFEEMKVASYMQKVLHKKASCIQAKEILEMATIEGAKVLGLEKEIGTLEVGKKADMILINLQKPHLQPIHDIYSCLVYSATGQDVDTTIVDGKIIMQNRELKGIDEKYLIEKCNEIKDQYFKKDSVK